MNPITRKSMSIPSCLSPPFQSEFCKDFHMKISFFTG